MRTVPIDRRNGVLGYYKSLIREAWPNRRWPGTRSAIRRWVAACRRVMG